MALLKENCQLHDGFKKSRKLQNTNKDAIEGAEIKNIAKTF